MDQYAPVGELLANDAGADGHPLAVDPSPTADQRGRLALRDDGTFAHVPNPNYHGPDSFTYEVTDGSLAATATVTIHVTPVNDPSVASADSYTVTEDTGLVVSAGAGLLANDTDLEGVVTLLVNAVLVTPPAHGTLTLNPDGSFTYTPGANFSGTDTFTYAMTGVGATVAGTATVTIIAANDSPAAVADYSAGVEDVAVTGNVLTNDADPDNVSPAPVNQGLVVVTTGTFASAQGGG